MGFRDSEYVKSMKADSIKRFDDEMSLNNFRKQYKPQIENGLTLAEFKQRYNTTATDIEHFNTVLDEVNKEAEQGQAFLKGFNNPNFRHEK